ncbi:hypothetical protein C7C46_04805 [Streptomyces tateyamensis]|uniref:YcaO domain-containing protein n=1 Tax=Streptomyces tateyamensis TaxID=565073 RepID=A0A2V4P1P0_9ACTN|nr:YcaO-like family protein [Streptomyces tateyamensis]PYC87403.1 hypothetical protein C7C46_04805 [Streptomyces tateyamensis]
MAVTTQGASVFLLGPQLALVRVQLDAVAADQVGAEPAAATAAAAIAGALAARLGAARAVESGFLEPVRPAHRAPAEASAGPVAGVLLCRDPATAREFADLVRQLAAVGAGRWIVSTDGELPACGRPLYVLPTDPLTPARPLSVPTSLLTQQIHLGEGFEGSHLTLADPARADRVRWAFEERLDALGFTERPRPLLYRARRDPVALARAIKAATRLGPDQAVLVDSLRTVAFATARAVGATPFRQLPDTQAWTYGMVRGLQVRPGSIAGSHVATCRTPAGGQDHLEGNSGKGVTSRAALTGAVGEAVERYAAYQANWSLPPADPGAPRLELADLHPYGPAWERHRRAPRAARVPVAYVAGTRLADGASVAVPKALVTFPYLGPDRPTDGVTTGLAGAASEETAVLRGLREVLERDGLYNGFSGLRPAVRLDHTGALARLGLAGAFPGSVWALHWPQDGLVLPDVHAFHHDPQTGVLVRASGSGTSFRQALDGAVTELCQIHFEAVRARAAGTPTSAAHAAWARPQVSARARRYLDEQRTGPPPAVPYADEAGQLGYFVERLAQRGHSPIVVRLPLCGPDWTVVRVLVPGATTSPYGSHSRGGGGLLGAPWEHGIPT